MRKDMHDNQHAGDDMPDDMPEALPAIPGISLTPEPLSRGPLGTVYRGWDHIHNCAVIVKTQHGSQDQVAADRFRREAAVMARMRHPNIVALYQFRDGSPSALVMEYVPGRTLAERVTADGPLPPAQAAGIIEGVAAALDRIHLEDIVHRDVKPSNILLPPRGPAKLTDFGVAHTNEGVPLTMVGDILGTIEYVSPEQVHGETAPDARSDVYSLAAVTYFALAGTPPFPAADNSTQAQLSVMHRQVFSDPPPLGRAGLSAEIEAAVLRGLAKAPEARPASAGQFAAGLRSAVEAGTGTPEERATAGIDRRAAAPVSTDRRTTALAGAAAGATLLLLGGIAAWKMETPSAPVGQSPSPSNPSPVAAVPSPPPAAKQTARQTARQAAKPTSTLAAKQAARPVASSHPAPTPVRVAVAASLQERRSAPRLVHKAPVTQRPRFRRHPDVVARAVTPAVPRPAPKPGSLVAVNDHPPVPPSQAWLSVYARQNAAAVPARTVMVDGRLLPSLAAGGWAALPAGKHLVSYVPDSGSGFSPNPGLWVTLAPGAHVTRQIPLPAAPHPPALLAAAPPAAETPKPAAVAAAPPAAARPAVGWYTLSGWAASAATDGGKPALVRAPAQWVKVDGQPVSELASGGWATLPAGRHTVTFQPALGLGVGAKTWDIDLTPQSHLQQQIPLPPAAAAAVGWYTVSGWVARNPDAPKPNLVRVSAQWVKVDGQPVLGLALGQWATLPAGKHTVTLQPAPGLGLPPKTWDIDLTPQAHLDQKIPLPAAGDSTVGAS